MMRTRFTILVFGAFCVLGLMVAQQGPPPAVQGGPRQGGRGGRGGRPAGRKVVLAWADTRNGIAQHDSVSHALSVIERLGYESGFWDTYIRTDSNIIAYQPQMTSGQPASGGPSLSNVDAIFFMGHRDVPIDDKQKADLLKFVHDDGKGFVAAHVGLTALMAWPEFAEMLGGQFENHPYGSVEGTVINEDPSFPATRHLPALFKLTDEFYQVNHFSREKSRVLLRLDTSKLPPNQNLLNKNGDFPLAWAKMYGKGRVFYGSFAHDAKTWDNPDVYHMYFEALRWALGLTDADVTPRPFPASATPAAQ
ncbi:MAG TPA: ThuA domain-containing protein [Bryobacteraceae bacterium]|nr:ThuA domain-containing protein [Bryobacteraceae bacterium]